MENKFMDAPVSKISGIRVRGIADPLSCIEGSIIINEDTTRIFWRDSQGNQNIAIDEVTGVRWSAE